jgi:hypothetical protein
VNNYPGQTEAERLGYTLYGSAGDHSSATYFKDHLFLTVTKNADNKFKGALWTNIGLVELRIAEVSFPNSNFHIFERDMKAISEAGERAYNNIRTAKLMNQF